MPFFFDATSQLVYVGHGASVRALAPDTTTRSATVVQHYYGHLTEVNDLLVHQHNLLSGSTELLNHCVGTGRLRWRALLECGRRISKLAVQGDTLIVCLEDCSVVLVHAKRGTVLARTDLKGERKGGIPFIMIDLASRTAYVQGNRSINAWSILTGARSFNTNLVIGQVRVMKWRAAILPRRRRHARTFQIHDQTGSVRGLPTPGIGRTYCPALPWIVIPVPPCSISLPSSDRFTAAGKPLQPRCSWEALVMVPFGPTKATTGTCCGPATPTQSG